MAAVAAWLASSAAGADPLALIDGAHSMRSPSARSRLARELAHEISAALQRIGAPSSDQRAAVNRELAAIDRLRDPGAVNLRAQRLYASPPFQQLRVINTLGTVRDALECAATPNGSTRREMACWAIAAAYLGDRDLYDYGLDVLVRSGRLAYEDGMTRARWLGEAARWSRYAGAIQDYITIPYLRDALD